MHLVIANPDDWMLKSKIASHNLGGNMRRIVFDIETCAYPFESLSESSERISSAYADKEPDPEKRQNDD